MGAVKVLPTKVCSRCERRKTYDHFYLKNFKPNGWCKECYRARHDLKMEGKKGDLLLMKVQTGLPGLYPRKLYQAPKQAPGLTDAEIAARGRQIALLHREIGRLDAKKAELRNEQLRLIQEITLGSDLDAVASIGVCALCGFPHVGECLNA